MGCCDGDRPETPEGLRSKSVTFKSEPLRKKQCTDLICLFFFVACIAGWILVATLAIRSGDLKKLIMAVDSQGHRCGFDSEVIERTKLLTFDIEKCFGPDILIRGCQAKSICVEQCPEKSFAFYCKDEFLGQVKKDIKCLEDVDITSAATCKDLQQFVDAGKCAQYYFESKSVSNICIPKHLTKILQGNKNPQILFDNVKNLVSGQCNPENLVAIKKHFQCTKEASNCTELGLFMENGTCTIPDLNMDNFFSNGFKLPETFKLLNDVKELGVQFVEEIKMEWLSICQMILASIVVCFVYIFLLKWFSGIIVWISVLGTLASLGFGTYFSFMQYQYFKVNPVERSPHVTNVKSLIQSYLIKSETWLYILIGAGTVFSILTLVTLLLCKRICLGIDIIKEGSRVVSDTMCSMIWPVVPWLLQIGIFTFGIYIFANQTTLSLYRFKAGGITAACDCLDPKTNETFSNGTLCNTFEFSCRKIAGCESSYCHFIDRYDTKELTVQKYYNGFMCLWCLFFVSAFSQLVLASAFSRWYWTYKKSQVPFCVIVDALVRSLMYHTGTLAFGSLIITFCRILRLMVEYVDKQCKQYDNALTKAILWVFRCFFWCLENFMKFVSKNAYIMTAIHGTNFCTSAKNAFGLLANNCLREMTLSSIRVYIFFLSKLFLSAGMTLFTFFIVHKQQFIYPALLVGVAAYFVADIFFGVYSMAVDTYFLCAMVDSEENDGTVKKPYYMSRRLSKQLTRKTGEEAAEGGDDDLEDVELKSVGKPRYI